LDLTKEIEKRMQACITHVEIVDDAPFHENIMEITRKGMHPTSVKNEIPLIQRHKYSQKLAHYFNENKDRIHNELKSLREKLENYNSKLKKNNIADMDVVEKIETGKLNLWKERIKLALLSPFTLLGIIHCGLVYLFVKWWVEKSFRRKVFYGSVKFLRILVVALFSYFTTMFTQATY